jgi:hypothetical protein
MLLQSYTKHSISNNNKEAMSAIVTLISLEREEASNLILWLSETNTLIGIFAPHSLV